MKVDYDENSDVLYIAMFDDFMAADLTEEAGRGVLRRFTDGVLSGITIIDFSRWITDAHTQSQDSNLPRNWLEEELAKAQQTVESWPEWKKAELRSQVAGQQGTSAGGTGLMRCHVCGLPWNEGTHSYCRSIANEEA